MADTQISAGQILAQFQTISALSDTDMILLQANRQTGGTGTQVAARILVPLLRAYIMAGFDITVNEDGYIVIGGTATQTRIVTELAPHIVAQTASSIAIHPNVLNVWDVVAALTITELIAGPSGYANEYMLQFTCPPGTATALTLPNGVRWVNDETPDFEPDYTYQVSIIDNMAVTAGWPAASAQSS